MRACAVCCALLQASAEDELRKLSTGMTAGDAIKRILLAAKDKDYFRCPAGRGWGLLVRAARFWLLAWLGVAALLFAGCHHLDCLPARPHACPPA